MNMTFLADTIHCLDQTTSTMDEARKLSEEYPFGAVMAESQSAGRGRLPGRIWETRTGQALLATAWFPRSALQALTARTTPALTVPAPEQQAGIESGHPVLQSDLQQPPVALIAGLAVAKACLAWAELEDRPFRNGIAIKWPNDVLCGNNKLAGILCEVTHSSIYVGMGVNCCQESFTGEYRTTPTSILMETGRAPERRSLLAIVLGELQSLIARPTSWLVELDYLLAWKGKTVDFRQGLGSGQPHRGTLLGVAEDGSLILRSGDSTGCFHSGELSLVIDE
jgi:BirA family biotin operon repressor/biotin-[acetyl-CoA-carboxylase] ligase